MSLYNSSKIDKARPLNAVWSEYVAVRLSTDKDLVALLIQMALAALLAIDSIL